GLAQSHDGDLRPGEDRVAEREEDDDEDFAQDHGVLVRSGTPNPVTVGPGHPRAPALRAGPTIRSKAYPPTSEYKGASTGTRCGSRWGRCRVRPFGTGGDCFQARLSREIFADAIS